MRSVERQQRVKLTIEIKKQFLRSLKIILLYQDPSNEGSWIIFRNSRRKIIFSIISISKITQSTRLILPYPLSNKIKFYRVLIIINYYTYLRHNNTVARQTLPMNYISFIICDKHKTVKQVFLHVCLSVFCTYCS